MSNIDFYHSFENLHRGSRELIKSRLAIYQPFVKPLTQIYPEPTAIDLGCGRGEWLEVLKDMGFKATGVDLNQSMLEVCHQLGLKAIQQDAVEYLKTLPDESQTLISGFHIAEHIPFEHLKILVQQALRVLKPGGLLILETPNPENIVVGSSAFYNDPTHNKPIPPALLSFIPQYYQYARVKVLRLQESPELLQREKLELLQVLNAVSPDYAVVAQKHASEEILSINSAAFEKNYGIDLETLSTKYEERIEHIETRTQLAETNAQKAENKAEQANEKVWHVETNSEQAKEIAQHAETNSEQAKEKAYQAEVNSEQAKEKAQLAEAYSEQAKEKAYQAEVSSEQAKGKAQLAKAYSEQAKEKACQAEVNSEQAKTIAKQAVEKIQQNTDQILQLEVKLTAHTEIEAAKTAERLAHAELKIAQAEIRTVQAELKATKAETEIAKTETKLVQAELKASNLHADVIQQQKETLLSEMKQEQSHSRLLEEKFMEIQEKNHLEFLENLEKINLLEEKNKLLTTTLDLATQEKMELTQAIQNLHSQVANIYNSHSWKVTGPLRKTFTLARKIRKNLTTIFQKSPNPPLEFFLTDATTPPLNTQNKTISMQDDPIPTEQKENITAPAKETNIDWHNYPLSTKRAYRQLTKKWNKQSITSNRLDDKLKSIFVDISTLIKEDSKSGIQRVTRGILKELLNHPPQGFKIEPIYASLDHNYRYAKEFTPYILNYSNNTTEKDILIHPKSGDIFLGLDLHLHVVPLHQSYYAELQKMGVKIFFVVYDLLPHSHPQYFPVHMPNFFSAWLTTITNSDGAICISQSTANELKKWTIEHKTFFQQPFKIGYSYIGSDLKTSNPQEKNQDISKKLYPNQTILMVGTIEPRKGHKQALEAFELLWKKSIDVNLVIVGKQGWMVEELIERLTHHPQNNNQLFWLKWIEDETLLNLYTEADGVLIASEAEGFGLPLIEAAQHKCPILARDIPVFREVAGEHAAYFPDDTKPETLAASIEQWLFDLKNKSAPTSDNMPYLNWEESTKQYLSLMFDKKSPNWLYTFPGTTPAELLKTS